MFEDVLTQAQLTVFALAALLRDLVKSTWFRSADLVVPFVTGATSAVALHGLQRGINGAAVVGQTSAAAYATVDLPGVDSATTVTVRLSAAAPAGFTVKLRIY